MNIINNFDTNVFDGSCKYPSTIFPLGVEFIDPQYFYCQSKERVYQAVYIRSELWQGKHIEHQIHRDRRVDQFRFAQLCSGFLYKAFTKACGLLDFPTVNAGLQSLRLSEGKEKNVCK